MVKKNYQMPMEEAKRCLKRDADYYCKKARKMYREGKYSMVAGNEAMADYAAWLLSAIEFYEENGNWE